MSKSIVTDKAAQRKAIADAVDAHRKAVPAVAAFTIHAGGKTPYQLLKTDLSAFSGHTLAVFKYCGMVKFGKSNLATHAGTTKNPAIGQYKLASIMLGKKAWQQWHDLGRLGNDHKLTGKGFTELQDRLNNTDTIKGGKKAYSTTREYVDALSTLMKKGGKIKSPNKGIEFVYDSEVTSDKVTK